MVLQAQPLSLTFLSHAPTTPGGICGEQPTNPQYQEGVGPMSAAWGCPLTAWLKPVVTPQPASSGPSSADLVLALALPDTADLLKLGSWTWAWTVHSPRRDLFRPDKYGSPASPHWGTRDPGTMGLPSPHQALGSLGGRATSGSCPRLTPRLGLELLGWKHLAWKHFLLPGFGAGSKPQPCGLQLVSAHPTLGFSPRGPGQALSGEFTGACLSLSTSSKARRSSHASL